MSKIANFSLFNLNPSPACADSPVSPLFADGYRELRAGHHAKSRWHLTLCEECSVAFRREVEKRRITQMAFKKFGSFLTGATFALALSLSAMAQTQSTTTTTSQDNTMAPQTQSTTTTTSQDQPQTTQTTHSTTKTKHHHQKTTTDSTTTTSTPPPSSSSTTTTTTPAAPQSNSTTTTTTTNPQ